MKINNFNHNASMVRGDSEAIKVTMLDGYVHTPGNTATLTVRKTVDSEKVISVTTEIEESDGEYMALLSIQPGDTKGLAFGKYVYDIELNLDGSIKTVIPCSVFEIEKEVTY